jgi:hypothetical protein
MTLLPWLETTWKNSGFLPWYIISAGSAKALLRTKVLTTYMYQNKVRVDSK